VMQSWARHVAKDAAFAAEYEDAYSVNLEQGRIAIADGVSSAIFSGRWARILTTQITENPPDLGESKGWINWLADPRRRWLEDIDFPRMPIHQKNKLRQVGGAYCTLCWIEVGAESESEDCCRLRAFAMGDSCVLHLRGGELVSSFPLTTSAEFDLDPDSICSVATSRDLQQQLKIIDVECQPDDVLLMVTDAIGKWMLDCVERGDAKPWERLWALDEAEWLAAIEQLRDTNLMKRDDTTMIAVQMGDGVPAWEVTRAAIVASAPTFDAETMTDNSVLAEVVADPATESDTDTISATNEDGTEPVGVDGDAESARLVDGDCDTPPECSDGTSGSAAVEQTIKFEDEESGPIGA